MELTEVAGTQLPHGHRTCRNFQAKCLLGDCLAIGETAAEQVALLDDNFTEMRWSFLVGN